MVVVHVRLPRAVRAAVVARRRAPSVELETATVTGREGCTVHTDRGDLTRPADRRCAGLAAACCPTRARSSRPRAALSRGLEVHPAGAAEQMQLWIDPRYVRAGYAWSFPAAEEMRVGAGSFWPANHVKEPTVRLAGELGLAAEGYQGNWIPHRLRPAVEDGVFFAGDSAGHCLPLTAEGIRTALYFGLACGRELRAVLDGHSSRAEALARYGAFSDRHARKYRWMLGSQRILGRMTPSRSVTAWVRLLGNRRVSEWIFEHYLAIAPPWFVGAGPVGQFLERQRQPADALLDGGLGEVGVAEDQPVVHGPDVHVGVTERVDADRAAPRRRSSASPSTVAAEAHDRVQPRRKPRHAGAREGAATRPARARRAAPCSGGAPGAGGDRRRRSPEAGRARADRASGSRGRTGSSARRPGRSGARAAPASPGAARAQASLRRCPCRRRGRAPAPAARPAAGDRSGTRRRSRPR